MYSKRKGDYLFRLKENQLSLLEDVRLFFESAGAEELDTFQTAEKNAGRIEAVTVLPSMSR